MCIGIVLVCQHSMKMKMLEVYIIGLTRCQWVLLDGSRQVAHLENEHVEGQGKKSSLDNNTRLVEILCDKETYYSTS